MNTVIHKWFWAWSFEKEENWLNEMAGRGMHLVHASFCRYEFAPGRPGEYTVRLELLDNLPAHPESVRYIQFLEDTGAEYVGAVARWVYLRKQKDKGEFDLFSDNQSRIRHLGRILTLLGVLGAVNLCNTCNMLHQYLATHRPVVLAIAILCGLVCALLCTGFFRILRKRSRLQKEQLLFE